MNPSVRLLSATTCLVAMSLATPSSAEKSSATPAASTKTPSSATTATTTPPVATTTAKSSPAPSAKESSQQPAAPGASAKPVSQAPAAAAPGASAGDNPDMTIKGGQEGTVFKSLTVEGEDRIHLEFDRPELRLELDPYTAPGLDWGSARDVLDRTIPDRMSPLTATSARDASPQVGHPWLRRFATGAVARFRPNVESVERWKLTVANAKGEGVATFQGKGEPPREIVWDGRSQTGAPVVPGLTYSYVLEAHDRAGNKRSFVGEGFQVSAYRLDGPEGPMMAFSANELGASAPTMGPAGAIPPAPPIVIEAATWLNQAAVAQRPIRVTATARSFERADHLARTIAQQLAPYLIGDPSRVQAMAEVQADAPEVATVRIAAAK